MPFVYEIDEDGFIIEEYMSETLDEIPGDFITVLVPQGLFYRSRWTGEEWVEGATQEEIDELLKPAPSNLSEMDEMTIYLLELDFRLFMMEMGI